MGFFRLTPKNARATYVAGTVAFVLGGALISVVGAGAVLLALFGLVQFKWEQIALLVIGLTVAAVGALISRRGRPG